MKYFKTFFIVCSVILATLVFTQCEKEYSAENVNNKYDQSVGIFLADSNNCKPFYLSGNYYLNTPLNVSNYALVKVKINRVGVYDIKTNMINGIYFRDSGRFTDTGVWLIHLKGYGIPLTTDTAKFMVDYGSYTCNFNITNITDTSTIKNAFYTLSGSPDTCANISIFGKYVVDTPLNASNYIVVNINAITKGNYSISTSVINGFMFNATGTITTLGNQTIKLQGAGKPLAASNSLFTLIAPTGNCNFTVVVK